MEFKGTKWKWFISEIGEPNKHNSNTGCHVFSVECSDDCGFIEMWFGDNFQCSNRNEALYNAKLIAHAPDMYDEIKESITDLLCVQANVLDACKTDNRWEGVYEIIQKQIDRKKDLLKKATTI